MKLFKKYYNINPITLDKEFLLKIESEVFAVWEELENDLLNSFRIDIRTHNQEIDEKGYSYKVFSDSKSKTKLSDQDIEDYIYQNKEEVLKKRISYPKESPKISYKDSENEYEVSSINDLFSLNLKDRFEFLKISVRGRDSKSIDISFSSRYMGASSDNTIAVSSLDDAWVLGTLEKIKNLLLRNEKPFSILYEGRLITSLSLLVSMAIVYFLSKIDRALLSQESGFAQWTWIIYIAIFIASIFIFFSKWFDLFPKATIVDAATYRKVRVTALWVLIMSSILLPLLYDICRTIFKSVLE